VYTRGDCRGDRRRDDRGRPVYTLGLQAIVATTIGCLIEQPTQLAIVAPVAATAAATIAAPIAPTGCGDDRPVYTPYNATLLHRSFVIIYFVCVLRTAQLTLCTDSIDWL